MALFNIDVLDTAGKKVRVQVDAANAQDAILKVKVRGYKPVSVRPADGVAGAAKASAPDATSKPPAAAPQAEARPRAPAPPVPPPPGGGIRRKKGFYIPGLGGGVTFKQRVQFTHQFSVLLEAGLPVVRSLNILYNQFKPCALKDMVGQVGEDVESGSTLSEAMSKHPKAWDKLYVNMIKAGEAGGVLEEVLRRLSEFMEKIASLRRKVIGASIYPSIVILIAITVVIFIMTFIVPKFREVFNSVGVGMPGVTLFLLNVSNFMIAYWYVIILLPFAAIFLFYSWSRTRTGRLIIDRIKLKMPIVGPIVRKAVTARFCRTLGTLLKSGVPILDALNIVRNATGNEVVSQAIGKVHDNVREGESIAGPLAASKVFDDLVINMVDVGEETGELDAMLLKIADIYDEEVDAAVGNLVSIMEPLMILGLGATVGFIVVALFLPLTQLLRELGQKRGG
jgi:type IV pilus assembly protein PilC